MTQRVITDPDVQMLADIAVSLESRYVPDKSAWQDSPFDWLKQDIASRTVGMVLEQLVEGWFAMRGFNVSKAPNSDADRVINGQLVEIKGSTLWQGGIFRFQQIRDQEYDIVICLGIRPFDAQCWVIPKDVLMARPEGVGGQHGGQGGSDTLWLGFDADAPPRWMDEWGGRLSDAHAVLHNLTRVR